MLGIGKILKLATGNGSAEDMTAVMAGLGVQCSEIQPKDVRGAFDGLANAATRPGAKFAVLTMQRDGVTYRGLLVMSND